jgi:hypothetical protein
MKEETIKIVEQMKKETDVFAKAKLILHLKEKSEMRTIDLAKALEVQPSYICHLLRLNRIPEIVLDGYYSSLITLSHLFVISRIKDKKKVIEAYERILSNSLSVLQTEEMVRDILYSVKPGGGRITEDEREKFIKRVTDKDNRLKIGIIQTRIKGRITVEIKGNFKETSAALREIMAKM